MGLSGWLILLSYEIKIINANIEKIENGVDEITKILDDYHDLYHSLETKDIEDAGVDVTDKCLYEKRELISQISMKGLVFSQADIDKASKDANKQIDNYDGTNNQEGTGNK